MNKELLVRVYRVVVLALLGYIVININWVSNNVSCDSNVLSGIQSEKVDQYLKSMWY